MLNKKMKHCLGIMLCIMLAAPFLVGFDFMKKFTVVSDEITHVEQNVEMPVKYIHDASIAKGIEIVEVKAKLAENALFTEPLLQLLVA